MFENEKVISFLEEAPLANKKWTVFLEVDVGGHRSQ
jgi:D-serine deaminase-like pyridoxal phosphate-dependent protein